MTPEKLLSEIPYYETSGKPVTARLGEIAKLLTMFSFEPDALKFLQQEINFEFRRWQSNAKRREFYARQRSGIVFGPP